MAIKTAEKIYRSRITEDFREQWDVIWGDIIQLYAQYRFRVIAHQKRARRHAPPVTLFPGGDLKIVKLRSHCAVKEINTVHLTSSVGKGKRKIGICNRLLNRGRVRRHRR